MFTSSGDSKELCKNHKNKFNVIKNNLFTICKQPSNK